MNDIATIQEAHIQPAQQRSAAIITPMEMIGQAVASGAGVDTLSKLMDLQERHEANNARRAFDAAIAGARSEIKPIVKSAEVDFRSAKGHTNYKHETLDGIAQQVDPVLSRHGLSYRFRSQQQSGMLSVTCVIAHRDGYSEETTLSGPPDQSGNKNAYQAVGSAATYLQRYTLKLALGLSAAKDDDGQSAAPRPDDRRQQRQDQFDADVQAAVRRIGRETSLDSLLAYWKDLNETARTVAGDQRVVRAKDGRKAELSEDAVTDHPNADLGMDELPY